MEKSFMQAVITKQNENYLIEFTDEDGNYSRIENNEDIKAKIEAIFSKFEIAKTVEEIKIEELEKEKEEILFILDSKLTNEERLDKISIYPKWERDIFYQENEKVRHQDKLYKVIQNHTSQDDWTPDVATSLFVEIVADEVIGEFKKPTGSHDAL